ncbi:NAD(P)-dependent oxidoreductase [Nocardioides sp. KIGAM211]|uniref:NAD(P)-dependent oxidoreductase n=1 Tax=Nocardioides luti TaxID=2761101 RepID=A0A7X0RKJ1_9ACTN|nr:NAD(P)-dependent oxidoreductase [Nocardioides luti]
MRVLVTGAAGAIGRVLVDGLTDRGHTIVGLDRVPAPNGYDLPWHVADCADPDAVAAVFAEESLDAVVHMAGHPGEASLPDSLTSHVVTTAALLDAMVEHDVTRFVYGGSNHAVGRTPRSELLGTDVRPRPDTYYGVSKVAAEALMSLYADRHGLDAVSCRIGSFLPEPETVRNLATWLSPDDCVRMVHAALTATAPGFAVLYGISANSDAWWDLEPGRALGYEPQDDAATYADRLAPREQDEAEATHVGGPYATATFERPALDRS